MLTFERRAFDARQLPVVPFQFGLGWGSFGVVPWSYGGMPALDAAPALVVPPTQSAPTGGMQLDIDPRSAEVYVDGIYAGVVSDFSGYFNHMELSGGLHFVTIMAPKYDPLFLQIVVTPGHTATYRGALTRSNDQ